MSQRRPVIPTKFLPYILLIAFLLFTGGRTLFAKEYDQLTYGTFSRSLEARMNACMGKHGVIGHQTLKVHSHFHRHPEVKSKREAKIAELIKHGHAEHEFSQVVEAIDIFHGKHKQDFQQGYMNYELDCRELTALRFRMMESELKTSQKEKVYDCLKGQGWNQTAIDGLLKDYQSSIRPKLTCEGKDQEPKDLFGLLFCTSLSEERGGRIDKFLGDTKAFNSQTKCSQYNDKKFEGLKQKSECVKQSFWHLWERVMDSKKINEKLGLILNNFWWRAKHSFDEGTSTAAWNILKTYNSKDGLIESTKKFFITLRKRVEGSYNGWMQTDKIGASAWIRKFDGLEDINNDTTMKQLWVHLKDDSDLKKLLKEAKTDTHNEFNRFTDIIKSYIDDNAEDYFGCAEKNEAGDCLRPFGSWDCATPDQKMNIICGTLGLNKNRILGDFFTHKNGAQDLLKSHLQGKFLTKIKKINEVGKIGPYTIINQGDQWAVKIGHTTANLPPEKIKLIKAILARNKKEGEGVKANEAMFIFGESMAMTRLETELANKPGLGMTGIALYRNGSRFVDDMIKLRPSEDKEDQKRKEMMAEAYKYQALMQMAAVKKSAREELLDLAELSLSKYNKLADELEADGKKKLVLDSTKTLRLPYFDASYIPPRITPPEEHQHGDDEDHEDSSIKPEVEPDPAPEPSPSPSPEPEPSPSPAPAPSPTVVDPLAELKLQYYGNIQQRLARLKSLGTATSTSIMLDDGSEYYIKSVGDDGKLILLEMADPTKEVLGKTIENVFQSKTIKKRKVMMGLMAEWEKDKFEKEDFDAIEKFFKDNQGKLNYDKFELKFKTSGDTADLYKDNIKHLEKKGDEILVHLKDGTIKSYKADTLMKFKYDDRVEKEIEETYYRTFWGKHLENTRELGKDLDQKKEEDRKKFFANLYASGNEKKRMDVIAFIDEKIERKSPPNRGEFLYRLHTISGKELKDGMPENHKQLTEVYDLVYGEKPDPMKAMDQLKSLYKMDSDQSIEEYQRARDMLGLRENTEMRYGPGDEVHPYIQITKDKKKPAEIAVSQTTLTLRSADGKKDIDPKLFEAAAAKPLAPYFQYYGPKKQNQPTVEPTNRPSTSTSTNNNCRLKFEIERSEEETVEGSKYFTYKAKLKGEGYQEYVKESSKARFKWLCRTSYKECKEKTSKHDEEVNIPNIHKFPYNMRVEFGDDECDRYAVLSFTVPKRDCGSLDEEVCEEGVGDDETEDEGIEPFVPSGTKFPPQPPRGIQLPPNPLPGMMSRPFI